MNQTQVANVRAWIAALRSGEYKQGRDWLRIKGEDEDVHRYCCLGVLCEINDVERVGEESVSDYIFDRAFVRLHDPNVVSGLPPKAWFHAMTGFPDWSFPMVGGRKASLVGMNDDGVDFGAIADFIERRLEEKIEAEGVSDE